MASHNTGSDAANTNVRAFLTKIGVHYYGKPFNHTSGKAKELWREICEESFDSSCAYCGIKNEKLTMEHLVMFNRSECGLHHPGNVVPCCRECNKRSRNQDKQYENWDTHLSKRCSNLEDYRKRKALIEKHIKEHNYPILSDDELNALKAITNHLYRSTQAELEKAVELFTSIDRNIVNKGN